MTRFWTFVAVLLLTFTGMFLFFEQLNVPLLENPYETLDGQGASVALIGISLLVADVILPVPSSLIMVANGAFFGIALGTILSLIGSLGASRIIKTGATSLRQLKRLTSSCEQRSNIGI